MSRGAVSPGCALRQTWLGEIALEMEAALEAACGADPAATSEPR